MRLINLNNLNTFKKHLLSVGLFALLATIIIFSWFKEGHLYGGGDVGIPSYDPSRIFDIARFIWWDVSAPGTTVPHGLTSVPFQFVQGIFQKMGFPYVAIQALFFWIVIFLMGYGMFLLSLRVFGKDKFLLSIIAALSYMFHPYIVINVWHRFIHTSFFLAALFPFLFIYWSEWIQKGGLNKLLVFLLINFLGVYMFGTLAFIVVILVLLLSIFLFEVLFPWVGIRHLKVTSIRFLYGVVVWFLIHCWWLLPSFSVGPVNFSSQHSVADNLATLLSISQQAIIPYSVLGINPFYIYYEMEWGNIYNTYIFRLLPLISLIFLIPGFFTSLKNRKFIFWGLIFVTGIFLAKGAASPFGQAYIYGFSNIFSLGVLRNPFEKLGILIPFSGSILIALGVNYFIELTRGKHLRYMRIVIGILLFLLFVVFIHPFWMGNLFGRVDKPAYVEVPNTYKEADNFIRGQYKDGNILHLPLTTGESATYSWQYGYNGVESSQLYFNSLPSISRGFNISYVDDALSALSSSFSSPLLDDKKLLNLLQIFNIRFIVLHKDMEWKGGHLIDPKRLEAILNDKNFLERKEQFGDLVIFYVKDDSFAPKFRLTDNVQYLISGKEASIWPWVLSDKGGDLLTPIDNNKDDSLSDYAKEVILIPQSTQTYVERSIAREDITSELPATRILPDSVFYPLIKLKEKLVLSGKSETDKFFYKLTLAGKRIAEAYKLKVRNNQTSLVEILTEYQELLPSLKRGILDLRVEDLGNVEVSLESIFARHIVALEKMEEIASDKEKELIADTKLKIKEILKSSSIIPYFDLKEGIDLPKSNRLVSKFEVPEDGSYELLQAHQDSMNLYYEDFKKISLQVDNEVKELNATFKGPFISYGFINLTKGIHEISFYAKKSNNLVKTEKDLEGTGDVKREEGIFSVSTKDQDIGSLEFKISPVTEEGWYEVSFDSWIRLGDKYTVKLIQDNDPDDLRNEGEKLYTFNKNIAQDAYNKYWNKQVLNVHIRPATTQASIQFIVKPWDDCFIVLVDRTPCSNPQIRKAFEHLAEVAFKNIEVKRLFRNPLFLRGSLSNSTAIESIPSGVSFVKKSPILYQGELNITKPQFLIFAETFHTGWNLKIDGLKEVSSPQFISNLFASSWFIPREGKYTFTIEFTPQRLLTQGIMISLVGWLSLVILMILRKIKK